MTDIEITQDPNNALMAQVLASGNIEVLERYIALKEREETRQAELEFNVHFNEMQSELTAIERKSKGYGYQYAKLEDLQAACNPTIYKHGFSYVWDEEATESGKRCILKIYGHGHCRTNSFDIPKMQGTKQQNAVQVVGGMSSYGRRYSFISGFGLIIRDEDDDAQTDRDPVALIAPTQTLKDCKDAEALKTAWASVYTKHKGDSYEIKQLTAVYTEMKGKLS